MSAVGVSTKSELRAPGKVYYPLALHLTPTLSQPPVNPNLIPPTSSDQPALIPSDVPNKDKDPKQPPPTNVVDVEIDEVTEVAQLKRKKKEKKQEKKGQKRKATSA